MTAELGQFTLLLGLVLAALQAVLPLWGAQAGQPRWAALGRPLAALVFAAVTLSFAALLAGFVTLDTSIAYVAEHASRDLPLGYRITASWGGHEGSLLLWVWMLTAWGGLVAWRGRALPEAFAARVQGVLGAVATGFLAFIAFTSNPFERLLPAPPDGHDLNPLLQDPGMAAHPPLLYMGYLLGSFWAYYELGWGGFWFWDAVENAAFMPWLLGTALIHSLAVAEKRPGFLRWSLLLALLAFSLSLLGTFLVRSGVVTSVHAFASDPSRGHFILTLLGLSVGGSLALFAWRAGQVAAPERFELGSRESLLLLNNLLLATATGTVLLGTLYPLAAEVLGGVKLSVGAPYFDAVFPPLMLPLGALMVVGPLVRWRAVAWDRIKPLATLALGAAASAAVLAWQLQGTLWLAAGVATGAWALGGTLALVWRQRAAWRHSLPLWLAHGGIAVFVLGVTLVRSLEQSHDVQLAPGEQVQVAGHTLHLDRLDVVNGPNYRGVRAWLRWQAGSGDALTLAPERRVYTRRQMAMTEAAIDRSLTRDVYLSLGDAGADGRWALRLQVKPFMSWVWLGALAMVAGGLWGVWAARAVRRSPVSAPHVSQAAIPDTLPHLAPTLTTP